MIRPIVFGLLSFVLCPLSAHAEVPIEKPTLSEPTGIAPAYFGPNAFPVIDMLDGRTSSTLDVELAGEGYIGYHNNKTVDLFARVHVPLFTRWANITLWMPVYGWYEQYNDQYEEPYNGKGRGAGDVYISTDIQILHNEWFKTEKAKYIPQMTLRLGMKTASGEQFERRRHYDCPGYFFDAAIGESVPIKQVELRFAGSAGFLCWQTDNGRQNDAVMYGLQAQLKHEYFSFRAMWSGYVGWENHGDRPMIIQARAAGHAKGFEPYVQYQYGIKDYPFHQIRVGLVYHVNILDRFAERRRTASLKE